MTLKTDLLSLYLRPKEAICQDLVAARDTVERLHSRIKLMLRRWLQQLELLKPKDEETAAVLGACFIKVDGQCKAMIMMSLVELSYAV